MACGVGGCREAGVGKAAVLLVEDEASFWKAVSRAVTSSRRFSSWVTRLLLPVCSSFDRFFTAGAAVEQGFCRR